MAEKGLDLSGLDDLLAEVNKKGNDYQEQVVMKKQVKELKFIFIISQTCCPKYEHFEHFEHFDDFRTTYSH